MVTRFSVIMLALVVTSNWLAVAIMIVVGVASLVEAIKIASVVVSSHLHHLERLVLEGNWW